MEVGILSFLCNDDLAKLSHKQSIIHSSHRQTQEQEYQEALASFVSTWPYHLVRRQTQIATSEPLVLFYCISNLLNFFFP